MLCFGRALRGNDGIYPGIPATIHAIAPHVIPLSVDLSPLERRIRAAELTEAVRDLTDGELRRLAEISDASRRGDADFLHELVRHNMLDILVLRRAGKTSR
jgi:hypothetical protein